MPTPQLTTATRKPLMDTDYALAAKRLRTGLAEIKAVAQVESGGNGFDPHTGKVVIRFEPHRFSFLTKGRYDAQYPALSYPKWKQGYPTSVGHSWLLFNQAAALNPVAAVKATSWGKFQVLGENYEACGCETLTEFVSRMEASEAQHLDMFCSLILDWGLDDELRSHQWALFAKAYNGKGYAKNKYDTKMATAYTKFGGK